MPPHSGNATVPGSTCALRTLAEANRITFNTLLQGAWSILLSAYTDSEDVVFGAMAAAGGRRCQGRSPWSACLSTRCRFALA